MSDTSADLNEKPDQFLDVFAALGAPFRPEEVKVRSQGGKQFFYVTARSVMNRLDHVLGPLNWWDRYRPGENSVMCELTIRLPGGETVTKVDAGGYAGMADAGDDDKSGFTDAFKRAAVKLLVGRYLYRDGVPDFVLDAQPAEAQAVLASGRDDAVTDYHGTPSEPRPQRHTPPQGAGGPSAGNGGGAPRTGRALFAWAKEQEERHEVGMIKYLNSFGKLQTFPGRMVDWTEDQVQIAYREAVLRLKGYQKGERGEGSLSK